MHRLGDMRKALKHARRIGCEVHRNGSGETVVRHPKIPKRQWCITGATRRDTPRQLLTLIRAVENLK